MQGPAAEASSRYRVIRPLGAGGMGVVELVHDSVRDEAVARKRILEASPEALLRFKREFRAIEGLRHPGLVTLYEMGEDAHGTYFTMEYVEGASVLAYCGLRSTTRAVTTHTDVAATAPIVEVDRAAATCTAKPPSGGGGAPVSSPVRSGPARCDWARVGQVLPQIVDALAFLHAHGIVHCDLKPSNVLVRDDGVAKVLDFGVIAEMRMERGAREPVAGTLEYMAPERLRGEAPTPAVDAYALGTMLFEMISGHRPFQGSGPEIVHAQMHAQPPRLGTAAFDAPRGWDDLCAALLDKSALERASIADVRAFLVPEKEVSGLSTVSPYGLLGRRALQARLGERWRAAHDGAFDYVLLTGATGAGKTSLTEWLSREARGVQALVLSGRARPSERIGFNLLDGAIDDLARALRGRNWPEEVRHDRAIASSVFPVLAVDPASTMSASRADAFAAFARVLKHVAATRPVLVVLDDCQWADADSLALVEDILERAPRRVMLAFTSRFDVEENRATAWVRAHVAGHEVPVTPLSDEDIVRIIERTARRVATPTTTLRDLVEASAGLPALAELAGRVAARGGAQRSLGSALANIIESKGQLALQLLALVVANERWIAIDGLAAIAGQTPGAVEEAVVLLERDLIVRRSADRKVDVYHDTVRTAALGVLGEGRLRQAHASVAAWLRADPAAPVYRVVHHLRASGELTEAARLARAAARAAEEQRAYGFAADMYALALTTAASEERADLLRMRARALERIGGYAEAGACWLEVRSTTRGGDESVDAAVHEAHCLLGAGEVALGYRRLDEAFVATGRRSVTERSWIEAAEFVVGPLLSHASKVRGPIDMARAERELAAATIVAYFDPIAGVTLLMRARRAFLREGALEMVALCELSCAMIAYCSAGRGVRVPLGDRWWRAAESRLPKGTVVPELNAIPRMLEATVALRGGDWAETERQSESAIEVLERAGYSGSHLHLFALVGRCELEFWRQDVLAHGAQYRRLREAAREGGAGPVTFQVASNELLLRALAGDLEKAAALSTDLRAAWPGVPLTSQRVYMEMHATFVEILRGDARAAWAAGRRMLDVMGKMSATAIHDRLFHGVAARAELLAWCARLPGASPRRARRYARRCEGAPPVFGGIGGRTLAYLEEAEGRVERAVAKLEACERAATSLRMRIDLSVARWQRGRLLGGIEGTQLQQTATETIVAAGSSAALFGEWPPR